MPFPFFNSTNPLSVDSDDSSSAVRSSPSRSAVARPSRWAGPWPSWPSPSSPMSSATPSTPTVPPAKPSYHPGGPPPRAPSPVRSWPDFWPQPSATKTSRETYAALSRRGVNRVMEPFPILQSNL